MRTIFVTVFLCLAGLGVWWGTKGEAPCLKMRCKTKRDLVLYPGELPAKEDLDCQCLKRLE